MASPLSSPSQKAIRFSELLQTDVFVVFPFLKEEVCLYTLDGHFPFIIFSKAIRFSELLQTDVFVVFSFLKEQLCLYTLDGYFPFINIYYWTSSSYLFPISVLNWSLYSLHNLLHALVLCSFSFTFCQ